MNAHRLYIYDTYSTHTRVAGRLQIQHTYKQRTDAMYIIGATCHSDKNDTTVLACMRALFNRKDEMPRSHFGARR